MDARQEGIGADCVTVLVPDRTDANMDLVVSPEEGDGCISRFVAGVSPIGEDYKNANAVMTRVCLDATDPSDGKTKLITVLGLVTPKKIKQNGVPAWDYDGCVAMYVYMYVCMYV